jgi:hypothetical protein
LLSVKKNKCLAHKKQNPHRGQATNNRLHSVAPVVQIGAVSAAKCMAAPRCWRGPTKTTARVYDGMISLRAMPRVTIAIRQIDKVAAPPRQPHACSPSDGMAGWLSHTQ